MRKSNSKGKTDNFFTFKSRPLVRKGSTIYYGDIRDKYVVKMTVLESENLKDLELATKVHLEMVETSDDVTDTQKIVKMSDKNGLYPALDLAEAWLERS